MYSKLNCLKNYALTCKTEPIAAKLTRKIQNAYIWSIQFSASDLSEILSVLSIKEVFLKMGVLRVDCSL